jgi:glyoxylase-like metal-dependent hydrolase (beta-lactamase superfamily II)
MRRLNVLAGTCVVALVTAGCGQSAGTLDAAAERLGATTLNSIEFSGTGTWFQLGQPTDPALPWTAFPLSSYKFLIDYETTSARGEIVRKDETAAPPASLRPIQLISNGYVWNMGRPRGVQGNLPPGTAPVVTLLAGREQPVPDRDLHMVVQDRTMEIIATPHGFLKAARANNATSTPANDGSEVSFDLPFPFGNRRYVGTINANNQVERIQTWIDHPVLGDSLVDTSFSDYRDFGGVMFPARIMRSQGGHSVLDVTISDVKVNPPVDITIPDEVRNFQQPPVEVVDVKLADGVYYLRGSIHPVGNEVQGSVHHSVGVEQTDHIVLVEAPSNEARSEALIAKVKALIPNKPIRYVTNSHVHFDHAGGLRTLVDEGATVVTHERNKPFYEKAWAAPRTLNPDRLERSKKQAEFLTVTDETPVKLPDARRPVEIYTMVGDTHNNALAMVYLPAERILFTGEGSPVTVALPNPLVPNPAAVVLNNHLAHWKLQPRILIGGHGTRVGSIEELRAIVTRTNAANATR